MAADGQPAMHYSSCDSRSLRGSLRGSLRSNDSLPDSCRGEGAQEKGKVKKTENKREGAGAGKRERKKGKKESDLAFWVAHLQTDLAAHLLFVSVCLCRAANTRQNIHKKAKLLEQSFLNNSHNSQKCRSMNLFLKHFADRAGRFFNPTEKLWNAQSGCLFWAIPDRFSSPSTCSHVKAAKSLVGSWSYFFSCP